MPGPPRRLTARGTLLDTEGNLAGLSIDGNVSIPTPMGDIDIIGVQASVIEDESGIHLNGTSFVPAPEIGFIDPIKIEDPAFAMMGYDLGVNIPELGVPLHDDRHYFYFNFATTLAATAGPVSFEAPGGTDATLVLDPTAPFFYTAGALFSSGDNNDNTNNDNTEGNAVEALPA